MENKDNGRNKSNWSRWLRVSILALSMVGPVINTFLNQMGKRSQTLREQAKGLPDTARTVQASTVQRLDELTLTSRERAIEQARLLRKQAQQLRTQAKQLRKALQSEAKQHQKVQQLQKQLQKSSMALGQDWLKRGGVLTGDLIEQSSKLSQNLVKRGGKVTHDLTERSSQATQELVKRGGKTSQVLLERGGKVSQDLLERGGKTSQALLERGGKVSQDLLERGGKTSQVLLERGGKVSQDLLERGGKVSQDLLERGGKLSHNVAERSGQILEPIIEPMRKRDSRFWTVFGFTTGLFAAGIVTYVMIRRRIIKKPSGDTNEQIELPRSENWNGPNLNRPSGEILHVGAEGTAGTSVATITSTNVENAPQEITTEKLEAIQFPQTPADSAFVGVVSTKLYYPTDTTLEANDVIYFASEDEAKAEGFIPAPTK